VREVVPEPDLDLEPFAEPANEVLELWIARRGGGEDQSLERRLVPANARYIGLDVRLRQLALTLLALDRDVVVSDLAVEVDSLLIVSTAAVELGRAPEGAEEVEAQGFEDLLVAGRVELDGVRRHRWATGDPKRRPERAYRELLKMTPRRRG